MIIMMDELDQRIERYVDLHRGHKVTERQISKVFGMSPKLAKQRLDRLVDMGLLERII
jgi:DNA-binding GntR family transcriptional regulator